MKKVRIGMIDKEIKIEKEQGLVFMKDQIVGVLKVRVSVDSHGHCKRVGDVDKWRRQMLSFVELKF